MSSSSHETIAAPPLYVDLDGTLILTDMLLESLLDAVRRKPWIIFLLPLWLLQGRAALKTKLADSSALDVSTLPYNNEFVEYLKQQRSAGRALVLATAAAERLAQRVSAHLGIFDSVLASSAQTNLKGTSKVRAIEAHGNRPFTYAGNDNSDLAIWRQATSAIVVNATPALTRQARDLCSIEREFPVPSAGLRTFIKAIRSYQWLKNALIFVPLLTAHLWNDISALSQALTAFIAFSLSASAIYVVNDLLDLSSDRRHPRKRNRPFASGALSIATGLMLVPLLLGGGLAAAAWGGRELLVITSLYVFTTLLYSAVLKTFVLADVITLAGLYTIRVIAGSIAVHVTPSFWLLAFSMSVFVSLALIKRCAELSLLQGMKRTGSSGRDYQVADLPVLQAMGVASGFASVLVLALFINSEHSPGQYSQPEVLWLVCCTCLYWITRMWVKTARGEMHDDPLLYAARDPNSLAVLGLSVLIVLVAR